MKIKRRRPSSRKATASGISGGFDDGKTIVNQKMNVRIG